MQLPDEKKQPRPQEQPFQPDTVENKSTTEDRWPSKPVRLPPARNADTTSTASSGPSRTQSPTSSLPFPHGHRRTIRAALLDPPCTQDHASMGRTRRHSLRPDGAHAALSTAELEGELWRSQGPLLVLATQIELRGPERSRTATALPATVCDSQPSSQRQSRPPEPSTGTPSTDHPRPTDDDTQGPPRTQDCKTRASTTTSTASH